jgi:hypothetical protein
MLRQVSVKQNCVEGSYFLKMAPRARSRDDVHLPRSSKDFRHVLNSRSISSRVQRSR